MMKKVVAFFLVAAMLLSMVSLVSAEGEKVKLTALFCAHPLTKHVDEMKWIDEIEEAAGVDVTWEVIYTDWDQVKSTRFASGDIPDLLFNATNDSDYTTYKGLFMDLTDLLQYAPNVQAMFAEEPDTLALGKTLEGQIYGVPKFQGKWPDTNTVMFVNKVWLDKLGLAVPKTLSELKTVLIAFRDNDCNGNGDASDEVPMDFNGWFGGAYGLHNLIGSWGIQLTNWAYDSYFAENGEVKAFAIDERYKAMMKYLADLYAEGLINENAITNDYSMFQSLSRGDGEGNALVGCVMGWEETDKFGPVLHDQYVPCGPFVDDVDEYAGVAPRWPYDFSGLNMSGNRVCMSAKCADPVAAMKFIDQFYRYDVSVQGLFGGIADGCVSIVGDNHFKVELPLDPTTDSGTWKWTSTFADNAPMYIRRSTQIDMTQDMVYALTEREQYKEAIALVDMENEYYPQMFMKYTSDDQNTMAVAQANVNNIINNYWGLWLTGESDVEDDWEDYVAAAKAAGLDTILPIRQAAFDAYRGK
ncbi:MAG: extracellular solute-binding protein [Clostridia bacterium]|nr:extracellular solute-binding protein [Clostridia bacterium]